jgi:hypothetical protein
MKRLLLPASALVLVLTACGAGAKPAPVATDRAPAPRPPSVKAVAAARKRVAAREAEALLDRIRLPAGARPTAVPASLRVSSLGVSVITEFAYVHRAWRVHEPLPVVASFVQAHPLRGFENSTGGEKPVSFGYDLPPAHGWPMQRMYDVELASHRGWTYVKTEAAAAWIYPRSPQESLPAGVREIDIRGDGVAQWVTDPVTVARIVHWFDALNVAPPGVVVSCMAELSTALHFGFRAASGAELASATVPSEEADSCDPISFSVGSTQFAPLIDRRYGGYAFVSRVQRLLGVCFRDPRRKCR